MTEPPVAGGADHRDEFAHICVGDCLFGFQDFQLSAFKWPVV